MAIRKKNFLTHLYLLIYSKRFIFKNLERATYDCMSCSYASICIFTDDSEFWSFSKHYYLRGKCKFEKRVENKMNYITFQKNRISLAAYLVKSSAIETTAIGKIFETALVFMSNVALWENFNVYFSVVFCQYWQNFYFEKKTGH